jgi:hypothetical protein
MVFDNFLPEPLFIVSLWLIRGEYFALQVAPAASEHPP